MPDLDIILEAVVAERSRQDRTWGGPSHDDTHLRRDWIAFIVRELGESGRDGVTPGEFERYMIRVAALSIAAAQSARRIAATLRQAGNRREGDS